MGYLIAEEGRVKSDVTALYYTHLVLIIIIMMVGPRFNQSCKTVSLIQLVADVLLEVLVSCGPTKTLINACRWGIKLGIEPRY